MDKFLWAEMNREELRAAHENKSVVVIPVGAIEQHGTHLPVDTDINNAFELAARTARARSDLIVAPPIWWGVSAHHLYLPGVLTLTSETFIKLVQEICLSIRHHRFERIVLLNGHGGNQAALSVAVQDLATRHNCHVIAVTYWNLIGKEANEIRTSRLGGAGHACEFETSLQLAFRSHLVAALPEASYVWDRWNSRFLPKDLFVGGKVTVGFDEEVLTNGTGLFGDPRAATAEKGEQFAQAVVAELSELIDEFKSGRLGI